MGEDNAQFDMNTQQKRAFIQALEQCHTMRDRTARNAVVSDLSFSQFITRHNEIDRLDIKSIVNGCLYYDNGLNELLESISFYEGKSLYLKQALKIWEDIQKQNEPIPPDPRPIQFDWVTIPAGEFIMGSNDGYDNEKPEHKVYLPEYQISRTPVTNEQWAVFLAATQYNWESELWTRGVFFWKKNAIPEGKDFHPVVNVSWDDCIAFCEWAGVRLPTEAEWEKAACGINGQKYPWGDKDPTVSLCNFNNIIGDTTPIENYLQGKSPFGCLDMAGNVWEWCTTQGDGVGAKIAECKPYPYQVQDEWTEKYLDGINIRTLRGGSFSDQAFHIRCSVRCLGEPQSASDAVGFRVCSLSSNNKLK